MTHMRYRQYSGSQETTIRVDIGILYLRQGLLMKSQALNPETQYWDSIGIILGQYSVMWGYIGIMAKEVEATIMGYIIPCTPESDTLNTTARPEPYTPPEVAGASHEEAVTATEEGPEEDTPGPSLSGF